MILPHREYALTSSEKEHYRENGYVLIKGVFSKEESAFFCGEAHAIARRLLAAQADDVVNQGWGSGAKVTEIGRAHV